MKGHPSEARLNDYVDGQATPAQNARVESHLSVCETCRAQVAGLRSLLEDAAQLPGTIEPERDLWSGIAARIDAERVVAFQPTRAGAGPSPAGAAKAGTRRWPLRVALAAAAGLLVVASSTVTLLVVRGGQPVMAGAPEAAPRQEAGVRLVNQLEGGFAGALEVLEASLDMHRSELRPETVAVIEDNLRIIDEAISTASDALAKDPANMALMQTLRYAYRQKLELLERAVRLQRI